jgi:hypothetical protein
MAAKTTDNPDRQKALSLVLSQIERNYAVRGCQPHEGRNDPQWGTHP